MTREMPNLFERQCAVCPALAQESGDCCGPWLDFEAWIAARSAVVCFRQIGLVEPSLKGRKKYIIKREHF